MRALRHDRSLRRKALLLVGLVMLTALAGATAPTAEASPCDDCVTDYNTCTAKCVGPGRFHCLQDCTFIYEECSQTC